MATATLIRRLEALERAYLRPVTNPILDRLKADPSRILSMSGMTPDRWQTALLRSSRPRILMNCTRQGGKSVTAAGLALKEALLNPPSLVLLLSPTLRQSGELFRAKVKPLFNSLGRPVKVTQESALSMELANGSRIVSLPGDEETIRCYSSVRLLVVDEASRVSDELYRTIRPMLAVSQGRLVCLSTPFGKRGFFYGEWHGSSPWERVHITADQCPRITAEFLAEERKAIGERWMSQEYYGSFEEVVGSLFSQADIEAALSDAPPFFEV